ncbi:MAG: MotA/TolQ/ExbB proton channel family protein [Polyangiales bacterium]
MSLFATASIPVRATGIVLLLASVWTWFFAVFKTLQLTRMRDLEGAFVALASKANDARDLVRVGRAHPDAASGRVIAALRRRPIGARFERLRAAADCVLVDEREAVTGQLTTLASVAAASPFIGLFGTVYGIMDAFARIGIEKSASLQVVAPAIGEALITTALGLATAIPALVFHNTIDRRVGDHLAEVEASSAEWVAIFADLRSPWPGDGDVEVPAAARTHVAGYEPHQAQ